LRDHDRPEVVITIDRNAHFAHPDEWIPLIFGGHKPLMDPGSAEERAVRTVFNRYNEVSTTLSERPASYRPIFMIDRDGSVVARDWAVGFVRRNGPTAS
jgi:yecA family protein